MHFAQDARGKAIKAWTKDVLTLDLPAIPERSHAVRSGHDGAGERRACRRRSPQLAALHDLPVQDAAERSKRYREELLGCARRGSGSRPRWTCGAPVGSGRPTVWMSRRLPSTFAAPRAETLVVVRAITERKRFFHWELEFPMCSARPNQGFSCRAWQSTRGTSRSPARKEFFSNIDPLFRTYGKQEGH
ncbi:hypothetical protein [Gemmatimonas sp.]|uniref:hypothetical protein n=1 Tax=Gemmatimonas sp. TaxID=1962908 RepID=UPI003DA4EF7C